MARYIDADKLWNDRPQIPEGKSMDYVAGFSECMWGFSRNIRKQIDTESADVVPKSELEAEHDRWLRLVGENNMLENKLYRAKAEVARQIFDEIEEAVFNYGMGIRGEYCCETIIIDKDRFAELKKKYTEEHDENSN